MFDDGSLDVRRLRRFEGQSNVLGRDNVCWKLDERSAGVLTMFWRLQITLDIVQRIGYISFLGALGVC